MRTNTQATSSPRRHVEAGGRRRGAESQTVSGRGPLGGRRRPEPRRSERGRLEKTGGQGQQYQQTQIEEAVAQAEREARQRPTTRQGLVAHLFRQRRTAQLAPQVQLDVNKRPLDAVPQGHPVGCLGQRRQQVLGIGRRQIRFHHDSLLRCDPASGQGSANSSWI